MYYSRSVGAGIVMFVAQLSPSGIDISHEKMLAASGNFNLATAKTTAGWVSPDQCRLYFTNDATGRLILSVASH